MKILAIDPGVTTGFALTEFTPPVEVFPVAVRADQVNCAGMWRMLNEIDPEVIVCESFEYRPALKKRDQLELYSRNLIGVIQLYYELDAGLRQLYFQSASEAKGFYSDNTLKAKGVYVPGPDHRKDAVRHLLHFIEFKAGFKYVKNASISRVRYKLV